MNFGKTVLELRKKKNVTQDEMAAELGVTAAAVSKWENNYTLPDILMLCALADYFQVSTDELLGRTKPAKYTVIAAETHELGKKIAQAAAKNGYTVKSIHNCFMEAVKAAQADETVNQILAGYYRDVPQEETDKVHGIRLCQSIGDTDQKVLAGFEMVFQGFANLQG